MKPENISPGGARSGFISETVDPRLIEGIQYEYRTWTEAVLDLTDNSWDARIEGRPLIIYLNLTGDELSIKDQGGRGMGGEEELKEFFRWGFSRKTGALGRYGKGGKGASLHLAKGLRIVCAKEGESSVFIVDEPNWDERGAGFKQIRWESQPRVPGNGFVQIELKGLKKRVDPKTLFNSLGDIYRRPILNRNLTIVLKGERLPSGEVSGLEIPVEGAAVPFNFTLDSGVKVDGWYGKLKYSQRELPFGLCPGIRGCIFGRKIEDGLFFGHPQPHQEPGMRFLTGEFNINSSEVTLMAGKSGFVQSDELWAELSEKMHLVLSPLAEELKESKGETRIPKGDKGAINNAFRIVRLGLVNMGEVTLGIKAARVKGEVETRERGAGAKKQKYLPLTPAPVEARGERKRLPAAGFIEFTCRDLGLEMRSAVTEEEGNKKLIICPQFEGYREARKNGEKTLVLYLIETAALELAKPPGEEISVDEYRQRFNRYYREFIRAGRKASLL